MAAIFAIKNRIRSVESTGKITKSMKLVSNSKLHQTQNLLKRFQLYSDRCADALRGAAYGCGDEIPLLAQREDSGKTCFVLFVGDRGLCGSYNSDILAYSRELLRRSGEDSYTVICGRLGKDMADDPTLRVKEVFAELGDTPKASDSRGLCDYLRKEFLNGDCDRVKMVFQHHVGLSQVPECVQLLPVQTDTEKTEKEFIFEPDRVTCVSKLCDMYMDSGVYRVLLSSKVSEHYARMNAMTAATDNAEELLRNLTLTLNRTRQAKITTEINEVAGGAKALHRGHNA